MHPLGPERDFGFPTNPLEINQFHLSTLLALKMQLNPSAVLKRIVTKPNKEL
jgi:hypothetical protein